MQREHVIMTEKEAKTKWCPVTFGWDGPPDQCIGSDCMWWVWDEEFTSENLAKEGETPIWATGNQKSTTSGHCGAIK